MPEKQPTVKCQACRSVVPVPPGQAGKVGTCPECDAPLRYPGQAASPDKITFPCSACGAKLTATEDKRGKRVVCPKCKEQIVIGGKQAKKGKKKAAPATAGELVVQDLEEGDFDARSVERKAYNAWEEMEEARRDSYYVALLRSLGYPFQAMGVVVFFILGAPLLSALLRFLADMVLYHFPTKELGEDNHVATLVVVVSLLGFTAFSGVLASFLFSITRLAAVRSDSVPVIQGARHRINLGAFAGWVAVYFGPGLLFGFRAAEGAEFWRLTGPALIFLIGLGFLAPMAFLLVSMHGGTKNFDFGLVLRSIGRTFGEYCYLLLMVGVAGALFAWLGGLLEGMAVDAARGEEPNVFLAMGLRFGAGAFFLFPAICFARMLGMFAQYHAPQLPFALQAEELGRTSLPAEGIMAVALLLLFMPLNRHAQRLAVQKGVVDQCLGNLETFKRGLYRDQRYRWPRSADELTSRFGGHTVCPLVPDDPCGYAVYDFAGAPIESEYMVIYDKEGNHPDGTRNVLFGGGHIQKAIPEAVFQELLELQRYIMAHPDDFERDKKLRNMRMKRALY